MVQQKMFFTFGHISIFSDLFRYSLFCPNSRRRRLSLGRFCLLNESKKVILWLLPNISSKLCSMDYFFCYLLLFDWLSFSSPLVLVAFIEITAMLLRGNHRDCSIHIERVCAGRPGDACRRYSVSHQHTLS